MAAADEHGGRGADAAARTIAAPSGCCSTSLPGLGKAPIPNLEDRGRERLAELYLAWGKPEDEARKYYRP